MQQNKIVLNNKLWPSWAKAIAAPADPTEYVEAAMIRFMDEMAPYVHTSKNIRPQFKAINQCELLFFKDLKHRKYVDDAMERYQQRRAEIEGSEVKNPKFLILVEQLKMRQACSFVRADYVDEELMKIREKGKAAVFVSPFIPTIVKVMMNLNRKYGIKRDDVSVIWGGNSMFSGKKADTFTKEEITNILTDIIKGKEVKKNILNKIKRQVMLDEQSLLDVPSELRLGQQDRWSRQEEIDNFQTQKTHFCLFTARAGGVGLSLHHCDDMFDIKVRRRQPSNYAIEEDIPLIPSIQRETLAEPSYSAIDLVQFLGRVPRLTSLSDTIQRMLFFGGTIEERVMAVVALKLRCLRHVVQRRESWEDIINDGDVDKYVTDEDKKQIADEDNTQIFGGDIEEEEEEEDEDEEENGNSSAHN